MIRLTFFFLVFLVWFLWAWTEPAATAVWEWLSQNRPGY